MITPAHLCTKGELAEIIPATDRPMASEEVLESVLDFSESLLRHIITDLSHSDEEKQDDFN